MVILLLLLARAQAYTFFVLTDIHLDLAYDPSYNVTARCHSVGIEGKNVSIFPAPDVVEIGRIGCDSPITLLESAVEMMQEVDNDPSFVLITGDLIGHDTYKLLMKNGTYDKSYNSELVRSTFTRVSSSLNSAFPTTQILFTLGNNDGYGDYQLPSSPFTDYLYSLWSPLNPTLPLEFVNSSYYACDISATGQRLVTLSTNFFAVALNVSKAVADQQLQWLAEQLQDASSTKQRVLVAMHIPPGPGMFAERSYDWHDAYISRFYDVLKEYSHTIDFVFAAHQHQAGFELIADTDLAVVIHPALSPVYNNNPGFRYYQIDGEKQEYTDYFLDLMSGDMEWERELVFSEFTGMEEFDYKGLYGELMGSEEMLMEYLVASKGFTHDLNVYFPASFFVETVMGLTSEDQLFRAALCSYRYLTNLEYVLCTHDLLPLA